MDWTKTLTAQLNTGEEVIEEHDDEPDFDERI